MKTLSFEDLALSEELQRAVRDLGFEEPTPIQSLSIPPIREGRDVIGQAHTGTGKTAAYGIPILEMVNPGKKAVQAVVLCPTRELAIQVSEELMRLAKYKHGVSILPVYGGQPIERQFFALKKGVQVIIATPGRMLDHLQRGSVSLSGIRMAVLDEADEMLDMGFRDDIEAILRKTPKERQTVLFSATMSREITDLAGRYLKDPQTVQVVHQQLTVPLIEQSYFEVRESEKLEVLTRVIDLYNPKLTLIFCNTKRRVDDVVGHLIARGYSAEGLHGDMNQAQRERVMGKFRHGNIEILVATDVAARGIDVDDIEAVVNYDVPQDPEYYVHRIGRTARAGRTGRSFTFVSGKEIWKLRDIQKYARIKIAPHPIPSDDELAEQRATLLLRKIKPILEEGKLEAQTKQVQQLMGEEYTSLEVAAALLKMQANSTPSPERQTDQSHLVGISGKRAPERQRKNSNPYRRKDRSRDYRSG